MDSATATAICHGSASRKTRFKVRDPVGRTETADAIEEQRWLRAVLREPCR